MKKLFILLLVSFTSLIAFTQKNNQNNGYEIIVNIKNFSDTVITIGNYFGDKTYVTDTSRWNKKNNTFIFSKPEKLPRGIYFLIHQNRMLTELVINDNQHFSISFDYNDINNSITYKNSPENTDFTNFQKNRFSLYQLTDSLHKEIKKCDSIPGCNNDKFKKELEKVNQSLIDDKITFIEKHPNYLMTKVFLITKDVEIPDAPKELDSEDKINEYKFHYFKEHYFDNIDLTEDGIVRSPVFHRKLEYFFNNMIHPSPDSTIREIDTFLKKTEKSPEVFKYCLWYLSNKYERSERVIDEAVFVHIIREYYAKGKAPWTTQSTINAFIKRADQLEPILIGKKAPDLIMPDTNDQFISMYSLKNNYTIVVFWATDCGHCKKEIPLLKKFYDKNKEQYDIEVYCIETHDNKNEWKRMIKSLELNWINVHGLTANINWKEVYDAYSTPVIYALDKDKNILLKRISVETIEDYFNKIAKPIK